MSETNTNATALPDLDALSAEDLSFEDFEAARESGQAPAKEDEPPSGAGDATPKEGAGDSQARTAPESETAKQEQKQDKGESGESAEKADKGQKRNLQDRFDKLTRERRELEERVRALEGRGEGDRPDEAADKSGDKAAPADDKPKPEDFSTYEEYVDKLTDWKLEQREKSAAAANEKNAVAEAWRSNVAVVREAHADYDEVIQAADAIRLPDHFHDAVLTSKRPAELAYELASDHERLESLAKLSPLAAAREIGRIEASLTTPKTPASEIADNKPAPKAKPSGAPKPVTAVTGGRGNAAVSMDDPEIPFADWEKRREAQVLGRRR